MTMEQDPPPLDGVHSDAPESLANALRALGRQRPSDTFLQAAAARLEASVAAAPRGALASAKSWAGPGKLLVGKLVAAALVLGGTTLALRSSSPVPPVAPHATAAPHMTPTPPITPVSQQTAAANAAETVRDELRSQPSERAGDVTAAAAKALPAAANATARHERGASTSGARLSVQPSSAPRSTRLAHRQAATSAPRTAAAHPAGTASAPSADPTSAPVAQTTPEQAAAAHEPPRAAQREPATTQPVERVLTPASEVELLLDAKRRANNDPAGTLRVVAEHARRFPDGALAPEREVLAIEALRALGRTAEAEQRLHSFQARYPRSIHARALSTPTR